MRTKFHLCKTSTHPTHGYRIGNLHDFWTKVSFFDQWSPLRSSFSHLSPSSIKDSRFCIQLLASITVSIFATFQIGQKSELLLKRSRAAAGSVNLAKPTPHHITFYYHTVGGCKVRGRVCPNRSNVRHAAESLLWAMLYICWLRFSFVDESAYLKRLLNMLLPSGWFRAAFLLLFGSCNAVKFPLLSVRGRPRSSCFGINLYVLMAAARWYYRFRCL